DLSVPKEHTLFAKEPWQWWPERDAYRCPAGQLLKQSGREKCRRSGGREAVLLRYEGEVQTCHACPLRAHGTTSHKGGRSRRRSAHEDTMVAHRARMETAAAKAVYRWRGQTIAIVFADCKEHRGLHRFSGRGLTRVRTELAWEVLVHNLLVLHRSSRQ